MPKGEGAMKAGLSRKEAISELLKLKQDIELFKKNIKGRASLLREIKLSVDFINKHRTEETLNALLLEERKNEFDSFFLNCTRGKK